MAYLLGLDLGTTGAKALLCDDKGTVRATAVEEYPLSSPYPLWSEQDPRHWLHAAHSALVSVIDKAGAKPSQILALGLTGQMHGAVFLDKDGEVIRPAILWNDQRTAEECAQITAKIGRDRLIEIAGNPALTGFQAPKIVWLHNHEPENYSRVAQVLLPKDYLRLKLTGERATDASDAAGTLLLDLRRRNWSEAILEALEIPRLWLPQVYEGPAIAGRILPGLAAGLKLPAGLAVAAGGGDNAAAAVGTGVVRVGVISSSIGTSGVLFAHSDAVRLDPQGRLHTFCHAVPEKYHLMAVTLSAGGSLRWLRDLLRGFSGKPGTLSYDQLVAAAQEIPPGSEGLIFLPYLSGERTPHLDPLARGAFVGLTQRHTVGHLARAVMEGVVFSLRDGLEIMRSLGVPIDQIRATGGGARSPLWRQMQADIYGAGVATLKAEEGPAYGAALLGGVAAGVFANVEEAVDRCVAVGKVTEPNRDALSRYEEVYAIYRGLYADLKDKMHALGGLSYLTYKSNSNAPFKS